MYLLQVVDRYQGTHSFLHEHLASSSLGLNGSFLDHRNVLTSSDCQERGDLSQETKMLLEKLPVSLMELKWLGLSLEKLTSLKLFRRMIC